MKLRSLRLLAIGALLFDLVTPAAHAQFNPEGRRRQRVRVPAPRSGARPRTAPTRRAAPPTKPRSSEALINRYTGIVLAQPGAQFPLQRLAELYRERDGDLKKLIQSFEKRAQTAGSSQWNALVALAGIYKEAGDPERAIATYEQAIAQKPGNPIALMALAHTLQERGDAAGARKRFEQALPKLQGAEREQTLRTLMQLALDAKDYEAAKRFHKQLVARAKGSFFVRGELGRELMLRREYERAVDEYRAVVKAAAGDNRVLAPALRDLGNALAKLGKREEALKQLRRAMRLAGMQSGIRREVLEIIVGVYRKDQRLEELVRELEKQQLGDFEQLRVLGGLYEETGQVEKALKTYRLALSKNSRDIGTRLKVVQLLQIQGELEAAIREYEALIRAAPRNPDFVFQLAEALIQRGDRDKALAHLKKLEARSQGDEQTLAALVDFYERVEEQDRALSVLKRLSEGGTRDPQHLVELGDRYYREGQTEKALQTWQRIRSLIPDRARALYTLGEVYLEHDMPKEGLEALREATKLKPNQLVYKKGYALALERTGASAESREVRAKQYEEARRIWEELLRTAGRNHTLAREARQHIVTLWSLSGQIERRVLPLEQRFAHKPPDLEAGRLLAEVHMRLRALHKAEKTLEQIVKIAPGDVQSLQNLERVLVQQRKLKPAIEVLKRLVKAEPKRAREYYQRMAKYAGELYNDEEAIRYAARAVELSPDDANGHRRLGEMYRQRQDTERAISAFRQALSKNDRLFPVYFQLAELLLSQGKIDEADRLLRRVVRASPDEELVAQATRLSMQVNLGRGTLESLEQELLPVALGNPQRPIYRRLLVEIYGALAFPLAHRARSGNPEQAAKAKAELKRVGERAVKPLLDALGDDRDTQQRIAIELLGHIENKGAGPALFAYATGTAELDLRVRAMLAVGALRDPELLPKLAAFLDPTGEQAVGADPISVAAAWAVARLDSPKARPVLRALLSNPSPDLKALGALGLGVLKDANSKHELSALARSPEAGPLPRAAAAFALGAIGQKHDLTALSQAAEASHPLVRSSAILALARLGAKGAARASADGLMSPDPVVRARAKAAALVLTTGQYRGGHALERLPEGRVDVAELLENLSPDGYTPDEEAKALVQLSEPLADASVAAAQSSPERARVVAEALLARAGEPSFGPFTRNLEKTSPKLRKQAEAAADRIAARCIPPFLALSSHPTPSVRALAVQVLATRDEAPARAALLDALSDPDEHVQRVALDAARRTNSADAIASVVLLLKPDNDWAIRVRAAVALGKLAKGTQNRQAFQALSHAAEHDDYALVRQAALEALLAVDPSRAESILRKASENEAEPRVRQHAQDLLGKLK